MVEGGGDVHRPAGRPEQGKIAEHVFRGADQGRVHEGGFPFPEQGTPVELAPGRTVGVQPFRTPQFSPGRPQEPVPQPFHGFPFKHPLLAPEQHRGGRRSIFPGIAPEHDVRVPSQHGFHRVRAGVFVQPVVRVHKHHAFPFRQLQPGIPGGGQAGVFPASHLHPAIPAAQFFQHVPTGVRGTVIHADDLNIPVRLVQNAFHAAGKISLRVIDGNDDGNHGLPPFLS